MDKYYTKKHVVGMLIESVKPFLKTFNTVLEPSAGAGHISLPLKRHLQRNQRLISIDIVPDHPSIVEMDFLVDDVLGLTAPTLVIGNPPYSRGLAIAFFNRAASYSQVSMIAFIVPASWRKPSIQDRLSHEFSLLDENELPENSFTDPYGRDYNIPCVIQVWIRCTRQKRSKVQPNKCYRFVHLDQDSTDATICFRRIGTYAGEVFLRKDFSRDRMSLGSFYFIEFCSKLRPLTLKVLYHLKQTEWGKKFDVAGAPSISKEELIIRLNEVTCVIARHVIHRLKSEATNGLCDLNDSYEGRTPIKLPFDGLGPEER